MALVEIADILGVVVPSQVLGSLRGIRVGAVGECHRHVFLDRAFGLGGGAGSRPEMAYRMGQVLAIDQQLNHSALGHLLM